MQFRLVELKPSIYWPIAKRIGTLNPKPFKGSKTAIIGFL
jgi:hypothetical protein